MAGKQFGIACDLLKGVKRTIPPFLRRNKFVRLQAH